METVPVCVDVNPAYPGVSGWEAEIPPIDGVGSAVVFEAAFNSERGVGIGLQPAASRPTKKWDAPFTVIAFERFLLQNLF